MTSVVVIFTMPSGVYVILETTRHGVTGAAIPAEIVNGARDDKRNA
jgi:hypothetical protein